MLSIRPSVTSVIDGGYSGDGKIQPYQVRKLKVKTSPKQDVAAGGIILRKGTARIIVLLGALRVISLESGKDTEKSQEKATKELPERISPVSR